MQGRTCIQKKPIMLIVCHLAAVLHCRYCKVFIVGVEVKECAGVPGNETSCVLCAVVLTLRHT